MLVSHFMITYLSALGKFKGSSYLLRAHWEGGTSATTLSFLSVPPSVSRKVFGAKPKQAGKKEGVGGGIPPRPRFRRRRISYFILQNTPS